MTLCIATGYQCNCQPDEGIFCPDYKPDGYVQCLMKAITDLRAAPSAEGWIAVSERLPEYSVTVLAIDRGEMSAHSSIRIGRLLEGHNGYHDKWLLEYPAYVTFPVHEHVTHWMDLPAAPKDKP